MPSARELLWLAMQHYRAGQLQQAEQTGLEVLRADRAQPDALHLLGVIALHRAQWQTAAEHLRKAIALSPPNAQLHLDLGVASYQAGNPQQAEQSFREALRLKSDFAEAHNNLGNALRDQGRFSEAEASFTMALHLRPHYAEAHNNLGNVLLNLGRPTEAENCYRQALQFKPDYVEAYNNLGNVYQKLGRPTEAEACIRSALRLRPQFAEALNNLGNVLLDLGRPAEAGTCYQKALQLRPSFVEAHTNLGSVYLELARYAEAEACQRAALRLQPDCADVHNNLGIVLMSLARHAEAEDCFRTAIRFNPNHAEAHNNLGIALWEQGQLAEAETSYRTALRLRPDFAKAHTHLGILLRELGRQDEAETCYRMALRYDPDNGVAHGQLALLLGKKLPDTDLAAVQQALDRHPEAVESRLIMHFGLAQVHDSRAEYAAAAKHARQANALCQTLWRQQGRSYDPQSHVDFVDRLIATFTPELFARLQGLGSDSERPVFIIGLPRSGTTLTEQVLASHSQVFGAGELTYMRDNFAALAGSRNDNAAKLEGLESLNGTTVRQLTARHLERLQALNATAARVVDKVPENYLYAGLIAILFPRARLIHCRRDLRDVALSCWMTNFRHIRWAADLDHIAARFVAYRRLMDHWCRVLPMSMLDVDYEEMVRDLEGSARRLIAWCGLQWEPACLAFHATARPIRTASTTQVRQPIYRSSVGRWQHYREELASLFARLEA